MVAQVEHRGVMDDLSGHSCVSCFQGVIVNYSAVQVSDLQLSSLLFWRHSGFNPNLSASRIVRVKFTTSSPIVAHKAQFAEKVAMPATMFLAGDS